MTLAEPLLKLWRMSPRTIERTLVITQEGIVLGKTIVAPFHNGELTVHAPRIAALLSVAYGRDVSIAVAESFRKAGKCFKDGNAVLANMHLALIGLPAVDLLQAQRLFVADWAMDNGVTPQQLLKFAGIDKFNPNHLGPGPGGQINATITSCTSHESIG